jgi:hypothetical protein
MPGWSVISRRVQDCQVCGRSFDPFGFQVVVPELARGFDRIECARSARALAPPEARIAAAPLVAIVEPITGALAPATASGRVVRPFAAPVATLGLLAAGTAIAALLWLRVLGADTTSFPFSRAFAPPAFGHETVQAHVQPATGAHTRTKASARPAAEPVTALIAARRQPASAIQASSSTRPRLPLVARPALPGASPAPQEHSTGKGHAKHGKGHSKHGETGGSHSPGHGHHGKHGSSKVHSKGKHG